MSIVLRKLAWKVISGANRTMTLDTWNGRLTCHLRDRAAKPLYITRSFERDTMMSVAALLRERGCIERDVMVDVGANIGMICIGFLRHGLYRRALAFEPDAYNFRLLQDNVRCNHLEGSIRCFNLALSSQTGMCDFELSDSNFGDHRLRLAGPGREGFYREEKRKTVKVPVRTFDQVMRDEALPWNEIGLVWVDIQGYEGHFLAGARSLLGRGIPVAAEFWPYAIERSGMSREEYLALVMSGFSGYVLLAGSSCEYRPISSFPALFSIYRKPREMCSVLLLG